MSTHIVNWVIINRVYCAEGRWFESWVESLRIFNFHQQKLSSLSIACDIKIEGGLYSAFFAEASKGP